MATIFGKDFKITFQPTQREFSDEHWILYDLIIESKYPPLNIEIKKNRTLTITLEEIERFAFELNDFLRKGKSIWEPFYFMENGQDVLTYNFVPLELQFEFEFWDAGLGEDEQFQDEEAMVGIDFWLKGDVIPDFESSDCASIGLRFMVPAKTLKDFAERLVSEFSACLEG